VETIRKNNKIFLITIFILNIIGTLLVLFTPFGGMSVKTYYGPRERFASLGSEYAEFTDNLFIILIAVSLMIIALLSLTMVRPISSQIGKVHNLIVYVSILMILLTAAGGVLFDFVREETTYLDWWLETGFYTGLTVGIVDTVFWGLMRKR
jgi:hypothetical protein